MKIFRVLSFLILSFFSLPAFSQGSNPEIDSHYISKAQIQSILTYHGQDNTIFKNFKLIPENKVHPYSDIFGDRHKLYHNRPLVWWSFTTGRKYKENKDGK